MEALQGAKKIVTGLETFMTGAENLQKIKDEKSGAGEFMGRMGGVVGGLTGLIPGAGHAQGRGGGYYGLQTLGESFALPAQQFLGLQARRAPQMQTGPQGGIVSVDPRSRRVTQLREPTADTTLTPSKIQSQALAMEAQGIGLENMPLAHQRELKKYQESFVEPTKAPTLEQAKAEAFQKLTPEQQEQALLANMGVDAARLPNLNFEQLQTLALRQRDEAFLRGDSEAGKRHEAMYQEAGQAREKLETLRNETGRPDAFSSFQNLAATQLAKGDIEGARRTMELAEEWQQRTTAKEEPNQLSLMLFPESRPLFDRVLSYTGGRQMSAIPAFINDSASGSLGSALDQALLDRQFPAERGGMSMPFNSRNPESFLLLQEAGLTEGGKLKAQITSENKEQYVRSKTIPKSQEVVELDAITGAAPMVGLGGTLRPATDSSVNLKPLTDKEVAEEIRRRRKNMGF